MVSMTRSTVRGRCALIRGALLICAIVDASSSIPTEASIRATKEKRERLRLLGVTTADSPSDEFISLSLTKQDPSRRDQGPHPESRLQREDDDVGEGDDGGWHVQKIVFRP